MLTKKLPDIVDGNPVKMALSLVKLIIQIQEVRRYSSHYPLTNDRPSLWQTIWTQSNEG